MLKYCLAAAGVGGAALLGGSLLRMLPREALPELDERDNALLQSNPELHSLAVRLRMYARFDQQAYRSVLNNALALIVLTRHAAPRAGMPRRAAHYISGIIDGVRVLRAHTKARFPSVLNEFDDVAAGIQNACTSAQHNITFSAQVSLQQR